MRDVSADEHGSTPAGPTASTSAASDAGSPGESPPPYADPLPAPLPDAPDPIDQPQGRGGRTFAALEDRTYRLLWFGGLFGFLAVQMEFLARGWVASELTGSNAGLGLVYLGFGVPMLLLTPWGGVAADRLPKRTVLMGCQLALASSSAVVAVTTSLDLISYPILVGTAVVQGAGFSFLGPARMAFTGELVGRSRLTNAIVLQQMSMNGTRVIGPSVAGALIGVSAIGAAGVYYLTTALMVAGMVLTLRLPPGHPHAGRSGRSPAAELADGVRYVLHRPLVRLLAVTSLLVVMFAFPYVAFLPRLAKDTFGVGANGFGLLSAASAVGALGASLFIAGRADGPRAWTMQTISGLGFGAGVALLAFAPSFPVALLVILLTGAASSGFQSLNNSLVLRHSDSAYHGRVQSLMMLSFSAFGIAAMPLGALADGIGLDLTMLAMGALAAASVVGYALLRPAAARVVVPAVGAGASH